MNSPALPRTLYRRPPIQECPDSRNVRKCPSRGAIGQGATALWPSEVTKDARVPSGRRGAGVPDAARARASPTRRAEAAAEAGAPPPPLPPLEESAMPEPAQ